MFNCKELTIASSCFIFDSTGISLGTIKNWMSENIGQLNVVLHTSFSGVSGVVEDMLLEEGNIYKEMFLNSYYSKQTRLTLRGIVNNDSGNLLSIKDGEQSIAFTNKNEVSKVYKNLANDSYKRLKDLVYQYHVYRGGPRQVGGVETTWPPSGSLIA